MAVKGLIAIALVVAVFIGLVLPAHKSSSKPAQTSQVTTLALR